MEKHPPSQLGSHSIRGTASAEAIRLYLESHNSPLAAYADLVAQSPYATTILGICTIEQYGCSRRPGGTNWNLWGIGGASGLKYYATAEEGLLAINGFLARGELRHDTVEKLNGWYVVPASNTWLQTVLKTKAQLE